MSAEGENTGLVEQPGSAVVRGASWVVGLRLAMRSLSLVSTVILARLLTPEDFGLVALAVVFVSMVAILGEFNFNAWLIQHPAPEARHYDTVWTLSVIRGLCVSMLVVALAGPVSHFYEDPRLVPILLVLAGTTLLSAFENVGLVDFQKHMRFDREFYLVTIVRLGGFVTTVVVALIWRNYAAIIAGTVAGTVLRVALSYFVHDFRPRPGLHDVATVFHYTKWLFTSALFAFVYLRSRTLIIGRLLDSHALGLFAVSQTVSNLTATELVSPIRRVLFPAYSKMRDDRSRLRDSFVDSFAMILLLGLPVASGIGLVAEPLVAVALGSQWQASVPVIQVLIFYGIGSILLANQGPLLMVLGQTRALSTLYAIGVILQLPALLVATERYGLVGAAAAVAAAHLALFAISLAVTLHYAELSSRRILAAVWRGVLAVLVMSGVVYLVQAQVLRPLELGHVAVLLSSVLVGVLAYVFTLGVLWFAAGRPAGAEASALAYLGRRMR